MCLSSGSLQEFRVSISEISISLGSYKKATCLDILHQRNGVLAVSTTFFNQQIFHSRCLATCSVKYMVFTGTVCPSYIHL